MSSDRLDRNMRFFGAEGQERLRQTTVAVVGVGGLGTHVVQQLSLLGVGGLGLVDSEEIDETNKNRYVGLRHDDPIPGLRKVDLGERIANSIDPTIKVSKVFDTLVSKEAFELVKNADWVFGCLDCEGARLILTELCSAYSRPYIDLASDIIPGKDASYGGRVCIAREGRGCLVCLDVLDVAEAQTDLSGPEGQKMRDAIYGVERRLLGRSGPSVVSVNGVVASLAVTEFMLSVTGVREPKRLLTYHGHLGKVTLSLGDPRPDCYYCQGIWGKREEAGVERYILAGLGDWLR